MQGRGPCRVLFIMVKPIFVYGSLQSDGNAAAVLAAYTVRRERACVPGTVEQRYPLARATFDDEAHDQVDGELVYLDPERYEDALRTTDEYEGRFFRRVTVNAHLPVGGLVASYAYEWNQCADYLEAARRKIDIARYHRDRLHDELHRTGGSVVTIPIQAHFEGILFGASSSRPAS